MNSCLDRVITGNQPHIAAADDEKILAGAHQVPVYQRLESACAINTGQGVAGKSQALLARSGRHEEHLWVNKDIFLTIFVDPNRFIFKHTNSSAALPDIH